MTREISNWWRNCIL